MLENKIEITMDDVTTLAQTNPLFAAQLENLALRRALSQALTPSSNGESKESVPDKVGT
jgi:hypothetical protein